MKLIFGNLKKYKYAVFIAILIKLIATLTELMLPYILEHIIDNVVPSGNLTMVLLWGSGMFVTAILCRFFNVRANRKAIDNAHRISYETRQALFEKTISLTGAQFDSFSLPSLISRMTSDSYNVQQAVQQFQTLCVRAPIMLVGGVMVASFMDWHMAMIMMVILPVLLAVILFVSSRGIPMYRRVQQKLDVVVRLMRESITGIRVVRALSKESYEMNRFAKANHEMMSSDVAAVTVMAIPGPLMQMTLNIGLTAVVFIGAQRVNAGLMKPGVILAFLTYFNMIAMGVMGLNRIFMTMSRATASADRIQSVLDAEDQTKAVIEDETAEESDEVIAFDHVNFAYGESISHEAKAFAGERRENALDDISFTIRKGESLGIIGPTGCGKTTIINLMMNFYDATGGEIRIDGRKIGSYQKQQLRRKFGTVFQNDMIFQDTLHENINFGRDIPDQKIDTAVESAQALEFIRSIPEGLAYEAAIKGANLSGGQKQRILVARALAAEPEILVLDDSSSALDYKTDASMRRSIMENYPDSTLIMIAQRVSSVMNMTKILVLDNGRCIGYGDHETLMKTCEPYRETYEIQMGDMNE